MAHRAILLSFLFALLLGVLGASGLWAWSQAEAPGPSRSPTTVIIASGSGVARIASRLEGAGVIRHRLMFRLAARLSGADKALQAGEYAFPPAISVIGAMAQIRRGETVVRKLTVAEGLTVAEVLGLVNAADGLAGVATMADSGGEGRLLPETYHFSYGDARAQLVRRMANDMAATLDALWKKRADGLPLASAEQALILASIVEKETAVAAERPLVAAVFLNRLKRGMRLQSDPTVAYGLSDGALGRALTRADLKTDHPHNTYVIKGLPPTPIANPGREALAAVLNPVASDMLYFVADGNGGHAFAKTLRQHNRNVARWRKIKNGN